MSNNSYFQLYRSACITVLYQMSCWIFFQCQILSTVWVVLFNKSKVDMNTFYHLFSIFLLSKREEMHRKL